MKRYLSLIICLGFFILCAGKTQADSSSVRKPHVYSAIMFDFDGLKLSHNDPKVILQEILDTNTVRLLAKFGGLADDDLAKLAVTQEDGLNIIQVHQTGDSERAREVLTDQIGKYVRAREDGHTKAFVFAALTNRVEFATISDPDLRAIDTNKVLLPISRLKKIDFGTRTNKAGENAGLHVTTTVVNGRTQTITVTNVPKFDEVFRWVRYTVTDGEISWNYEFTFRPDGKIEHIWGFRRDAKEVDPRFEKVMKEVDAEIDAEVKRSGKSGKSGTFFSEWQLKKEKLKLMGIDWRSPEELNPNTRW